MFSFFFEDSIKLTPQNLIKNCLQRLSDWLKNYFIIQLKYTIQGIFLTLLMVYFNCFFIPIQTITKKKFKLTRHILFNGQIVLKKKQAMICEINIVHYQFRFYCFYHLILFIVTIYACISIYNYFRSKLVWSLLGFFHTVTLDHFRSNHFAVFKA